MNCWVEIIIRKDVVAYSYATRVASEWFYEPASARVVLYNYISDGNILTVVDVKDSFREISAYQTPLTR